MSTVTIYTDGACSGNGTANSRGGWAAIVKLNDSDQPHSLSGGERPGTNQRMELRAAIEGLRALTSPSRVTLYSDSAYLINCMNKHWYRKWRANGWVGSSRKPVANRELWEELLDLVENQGHTVNFVKVAGHANAVKGHISSEHERFNQLCDEMAVAAVPASPLAREESGVSGTEVVPAIALGQGRLRERLEAAEPARRSLGVDCPEGS